VTGSSPLRLTVLGCAGTFPGPDSPCSSYLVEYDGFRLVIDLGPGSLGQLQRHIGLLDVDAVLVSHLHADHCLDLVAYSYARRYAPAGIPPRLPVYGPPGTGDRICAAFDTAPVDGLLDVYDFRPVPSGPFRIGPLDIRTTLTNHPVPCYAVRVEAGGRAITYSADTGESAAVAELARDTDLFLCEASWADSSANPPGLHLSGREAGEHATRARARRLLLTHVVAWTDPGDVRAEAAEAFAGEVALARCGSTYDV
jgi:ribonuclease BN (tRNA processing enzyme)